LPEEAEGEALAEALGEALAEALADALAEPEEGLVIISLSKEVNKGNRVS